MIEVHVATPLRPLVRGARTVNAEGKDLRQVLNNLEARQWDKVAERCMSCASCTQISRSIGSRSTR